MMEQQILKPRCNLPMKHSDRPILRPREDVLGRSKFSLSLARAIDDLALARDGFVIGIIGEWGSGKSSVIEMILRSLTHLEMERTGNSIIKNIPELASAPSTLEALENFAETYDLIRDKIEIFDQKNSDFSKAHYKFRHQLFRESLKSSEEAIKADIYWQLLEAVRSSPKTIQVRFSPWLIAGRGELATALMSELARALGENAGPDIREAFASFLERLSELAPIAGAGLDAATGTGFGRLLSATGSLSKSAAAKLASGPTLDKLRENLRNLLRHLPNQKILVVIDDLDRLMPNEAAEMVSLVKTLGDLPNVVYLLSYDQKNLAKLIAESMRLDGVEYLQKIVQYPVHLPPLLGDKLSKILDADISELLGELDTNDTRRIGSTWYFALRHYLKTPRDVRLYTNSLTVTLASQRDYVDPIDQMMLEILRLHEPDVYSWVRENLSELTE